MTTDQQAALFRVHRRAAFMLSEAEAHLRKAAAESGDGEALKRAAQVVDSVKALQSYVHGVLWQEGVGDERTGVGGEEQDAS